MFCQNGNHLILRVDGRKQDSVFQFLKNVKTKQMVGFISGGTT